MSDGSSDLLLLMLFRGLPIFVGAGLLAALVYSYRKALRDLEEARKAIDGYIRARKAYSDCDACDGLDWCDACGPAVDDAGREMWRIWDRWTYGRPALIERLSDGD